MGVFSEMDAEQMEQGENTRYTSDADTGGTAARTAPYSEARQQAEADAALSERNEERDIPAEDPPDEADGEDIAAGGDSGGKESPKDDTDRKKAEHEAAEAKRKAEWDAKQAKKKAAFEKALRDLLDMTDDDVMGASVKRTGSDLEKLTRRNMKLCVTEVIQTKCLEDPAFARMVCHPHKSLINCFKHIYKKAEMFVKQELEMNGEKTVGAFVEDVPDDLCYQWAEEYFSDPNAEADKDKDDEFVPKRFYGGSSSTKPKKKEPAKKKEQEKPKSAAPAKNSEIADQMNLFGGEAA